MTTGSSLFLFSRGCFTLQCPSLEIEEKQHMFLCFIDINTNYLSIKLLELCQAEFITASENAVISIDEISVGLDHETLKFQNRFNN